MKRAILLSPELLCEIFDYDQRTGSLIWRTRPRHHFKNDRSWVRSNRHTAGTVAGSVRSSGYRFVEITVDGKRYIYGAYRIVWVLMTGKWAAHEIDHFDLDKDNNRWGNLRAATHLQNSYNCAARKHNKSGIKGVSSTVGGTFTSEITVNRKRIYLGTFYTAEAAGKAYAKAAKLHHREFARCG